MHTQDSAPTQVTFHYTNGQTESYSLHAPLENDGTLQTTQLEVRHLLKKDWWIIHLPEHTVFINVDNVIRVEMKPPIPELRGEDVFSNAERITALNRGR